MKRAGRKQHWAADSLIACSVPFMHTMAVSKWHELTLVFKISPKKERFGVKMPTFITAQVPEARELLLRCLSGV